MIRCMKCGSTLAPHARFCSVCGAEAVPATPQNANATQAFDRTQGISAPQNLDRTQGIHSPQGGNPTGNPTQGLNQTQNINRTQGFGRTAAFGASDLGATSAFSAQQGYGTPGAPDPNAEAKKRRAIMIGVGSTLAIVAGLILVSASGILGAKKPTNSNAAVLSAPPTQAVQAPVLAAPATNIKSVPVMEAPATKGTAMPQDVIDYLRWLKQFESGRQALQSKSEAQMLLVVQEMVKVGMVGTAGMGLLDGDSEEASRHKQDATSAIDMKAVNGVIQDWNNATGIFQQKTPPNPCATLASNYNQGLTGSVSAMTQVLGAGVKAIQSISNADGQKTGDATEVLSFLKDQHNNHGLSQNIETAFSQSNEALDALRSQYSEIPADIDRGQFSIKSSNSGQMNIPIPGLGM